VVFPQRLLDEHVLSEAQLERMRRNAVEVVDYACRFVSEQPPASTDNLLSGLHSDGEELRDLVYQDIDEFRETKEEKYLTGISLALRRGMERDPHVFVIGEEVGRLGGAFGATKGLYHLFPDRVLDAPISEAGFVGMALGAALRGYRPVVEIMYADFALVAGDQLMNQIAKVRYMYGNQFNVPLMVRSRTAIGTGYGAQHTLDPAAFYALYPGWRIVAPSNTFDMIGLMNTALASNDPVLFLEHHSLYQDRSAIPASNLDFAVPFGQAKVYGDGEDLVVVSYSYMSTLCRKALDELRSENIACTFIDLRTLDYLHIDWTCLKRHLSRIGRMLICEQAPLHGSVGAQIADTLHRECFDSLDGPIHRLGGQNIPLPVSKRMEQCAIPQLDDVKNAIRNMVIDYSPRFGR
jgi:2-oxoisovalerate dehydrogenase E1 component